jgi:hypothetical protein
MHNRDSESFNLECNAESTCFIIVTVECRFHHVDKVFLILSMSWSHFSSPT